MSDVHLDVENIGGISSTTVSFERGPTLLVGTNASNKTSLLQSARFALGVDDPPVRSGASEAAVTLRVGDAAVERRAGRNGDGYRVEGDGWVTDPDDALLVRRFACLLGTNRLRSAVSTTADIASLLKEPMDIDALEAERAEKLERKRDLRREVDSLTDVDDRLESERAELADERERIDELEETLEDLYDRQEETETDDDRLQELRERRTDLRGERDTYAAQIDDLEATIERLEERRSTVAATLEEATEEAESHDVQELRRRRDDLREELAEITDRVDVLQSVLTANREMLDSSFSGSLGYESGLAGDELTCWACGTDAPRPAFEETVDELRELVTREKRRKREQEPELEEIESAIEAADDARRRVQDLEAELDDLDQRLQQRRDSLERKREAFEGVDEKLATVDAEIADRRSEHEESRSDVATAIEETRLELQDRRRDVERLETSVAELESKRDERERKRDEIQELTDEIQELTDRIENLERDLRSVFNETMDDLIDHLEFDRIDRVRLDADFELVVVREIDGAATEDSVDHLAESEREIIGIVLGLAGFVVYDVDDRSPLLLLDSLGAFDATRTERLVEYVADTTDAVLAAVHPEVADSLSYESIRME